MLNEQDKISIGEAIDRLNIVPMANWVLLKGLPIWKLYDAAREKAGEPLSLYAAKGIEKAVKPGDAAIVTTGFVVANAERGETDGPTGAAAIARAIDVGLKGTPVMVTEEMLTGVVNATCQAAGLNHYAKLEDAKAKPHRMHVRGYPTDPAEGKRMASKLLDEINPSVIISVERPSHNEKGVWHSGGGFDISRTSAKIDYLVEEARDRGIFTVGIGDLGNELGMGYIKDAVKKYVPGAVECKCPCKGGVASDVATDACIVATVSNWGGYGIAAMLAALVGEPEVFHDMQTEKLMLRACAAAGGIDSVAGMSRPWADGVSEEVTSYLVEMLRQIILVKLRESMFTRDYKRVVK